MKTKSSAIFIAFAFGLITPLPKTDAVVPPPNGCYPNFTTAEGCDALSLLTTGAANTGLGWRSLFSNSTGGFNTGVGAGALVLNNADSNTAFGAGAMLLNTSGANNTANGAAALVYNNTGHENTALGASALFSNTEGSANTANGFQALASNTAGVNNVAVGTQALQSSTNADFNTAVGYRALFGNTTSSANTAVGDLALENHTTVAGGNVAVGVTALRMATGGGNTAVGDGAGNSLTTGNNNVYIGAAVFGVAGESNTTRIGAGQTRSFIDGIRGVTTGNNNAINVVIDSVGQLGTMSSSRRFKNEIKPMDQTSKAIHALKPVTFHYKSDNTGTPQFGLIAEEVAEVNPDLVVRDADGEIYTVRYDAVNAMLLNEFLKEHRKVEEQARKMQEQRAIITELKKEMANVAARLNEQDSKIQKVSNRLERKMPAAQIVLNNQ